MDSFAISLHFSPDPVDTWLLNSGQRAMRCPFPGTLGPGRMWNIDLFLFITSPRLSPFLLPLLEHWQWGAAPGGVHVPSERLACCGVSCLALVAARHLGGLWAPTGLQLVFHEQTLPLTRTGVTWISRVESVWSVCCQ